MEWKNKVTTYESMRSTLAMKNENSLTEADYEFINRYGCGCSYDFTDFGMQLLNSDEADMECLIDDFTSSGCKNWEEFSNFIIDDYMSILLKYLKE